VVVALPGVVVEVENGDGPRATAVGLGSLTGRRRGEQGGRDSSEHKRTERHQREAAHHGAPTAVDQGAPPVGSALLTCAVDRAVAMYAAAVAGRSPAESRGGWHGPRLVVALQ